eukprot:CAMPEP_0177778998 /NCGR_PEP_ID=MMETSP0491_2-20121128/16302_1 /TAXON_ID=63592 /ORGANISM="Tetraselmis chuii, Strain PLY429" /LENGTH=124 /DNA_ID=CAMNT_0019298407 /DNA_START=459 /DNA_END=832 /DNA_ORIENTATION=+
MSAWTPQLTTHPATVTAVAAAADHHNDNHDALPSYVKLGWGPLTASLLISYVIVSPAAVAMWRGWWMLTDLHLLPSNKFASYLVCIGASVAWLATYLVARVLGLLDWAERAGRRAPWAACLAER